MINIIAAIKDEKKSSREYRKRSYFAKNEKYKKAFREMADDEAKHARMLEGMLQLKEKITVKGHKRRL